MLTRARRHDENDAEWDGLNRLTYRVVIPVITSTYADACLQSIAAPNSAAGFELDRVLVVDNSRDGLLGRKYSALYGERGLRVHRDADGFNLGVARSWNVGAREVLAAGLDYLVICSASMMFGPILHTTWTRQMVTFAGERVIECDGHSWHLIAFHRSVIEAVGLFDENCYPAYHEANDYSFRMRQLGWEGGWRHAWVNALSQSVAGHVDVVRCPAPPIIDYLREKWGGEKHHERHSLPWGDRPLGYFPARSIPERAEAYGLGERGVGWW